MKATTYETVQPKRRVSKGAWSYPVAMAIMRDVATRSMRAGGRIAWSKKDYNAGVAAFNRVYPKGA